MTETTPAKPRLEPNCRLLTPAGAAGRERAGGPPIPETFLRCLRDAEGRLTAGLQPVAGPSGADWDNGVRLTDVCDEIMVNAVIAERGGGDDDRRTALLGIAWRRAGVIVKRPFRCWLPPQLRPYTVRMRPDGSRAGGESEIEVLAGSRIAACAAAAAAVFDHAGRTADAALREPR